MSSIVTTGWPRLWLLAALFVTPLYADDSRHPDVSTIPADIENPAITDEEPAPGRMSLQRLPTYVGTEVAHTLYLPPDWTSKKTYPVIIEFLGNRSRVRDNRGIGFGITGGKGFIWVVLPFVSEDGKQDMDMWWGDTKATVAYAKEVVASTCRQWGGDPARIVLTGYSRGAIACNFIGLHDDEIAKLWRAMLPISHYDDAHTAWGMTPEEQSLAPDRLRRLGKTPQLICGEHSSPALRGTQGKLVQTELSQDKDLTFAAAKAKLGLEPITELEGTRQFIAQHYPNANISIINLLWINHEMTIFHRDTPERRKIRDWLQQVMRETHEK